MYFALEAKKWVLELTHLGQNRRMGNKKAMRCLCSASNRKTMRTSLGTGKGRLHDLDKDEAAISCDLYGREIHFTNSKTLVGWSMSRPTVTRVAFDLPECKEQK